MTLVRLQDVESALSNVKSMLGDIESVASDAEWELSHFKKFEPVDVFKCSRCRCDGGVYPYPAMRLRGGNFYCEACYAAHY